MRPICELIDAKPALDVWSVTKFQSGCKRGFFAEGVIQICCFGA